MGRTPAVDRLLESRPDLLAGWQGLEESVWSASGVPTTVLSLCRLRVHELLGCPAADPGTLDPTKAAEVSHWPTDPIFDDGERACLAYTEQFVIDPHGVQDAQTAAVTAALSPSGLVALSVALGMFEAGCRLHLLFQDSDDAL